MGMCKVYFGQVSKVVTRDFKMETRLPAQLRPEYNRLGGRGWWGCVCVVVLVGEGLV